MRIRSFAGWVAALAAVGAVSGQDYLSSEALHAARLTKYWQLQLPVPAGDLIDHLFLVDGQLYATTAGGLAYAVDAATGAVRWVQQVTNEGYELSRPCHVGDEVAFATPSSIRIYGKYNGRPAREIRPRFPVASAPMSDGRFLFVGGLNQRFYCLDPLTGFERWKTTTAGPASSAATTQGKLVYFAGDEGVVYGCTAANKVKEWIFRTFGRISADLASDQNGIYVASLDQSLYMIERGSGKLMWRARLSGPLLEAPTVTPLLAYQFEANDGITAIDVAPLVEDRVRWKLRRGRTLLTTHEGSAIVLSRDGALLVVREEDGTVRHEVPAAGMTMGVSWPDAATAIMASNNGRIFCARPIGTPPLLASEVTAALVTAGEKAEGEAEVEASLKTDESEITIESPRRGPPVGGKSKVTRQLGGG